MGANNVIVIVMALFRGQHEMVLQAVHQLILSLPNVSELLLSLAYFALYLLGAHFLFTLLLHNTGQEAGRVRSVSY